jgi:hypothetical protein
MTSVSIPVYNKKNHTVGTIPFSSFLSTVSQTALFSSIFFILCCSKLYYSTITIEFFFSCSFFASFPAPPFSFQFFSFKLDPFCYIISLSQLLHFADSFLFINFNPQLWCPLSLFYGMFILFLAMKLIIDFLSISGYEFSCFISSLFCYLGIFCIFTYIKAVHPPFFIEYYISTHSTVEHHIPKEIGVLKSIYDAIRI